jgi:adenylosuccinate lyase
MKVWRGEGDFRSLLQRDETVRKYLSEAEIDSCFDLEYHLKHVDTVFARVFGDTESAQGKH